MMSTYRLTRLGESSPIGRLFTLGSFSKITEVAHIFCYFFQSTNHALILTKMGWATFWAIFSQTDLVTLSTCFMLRMCETWDTHKK
jgi:hypothetical protein